MDLKLLPDEMVANVLKYMDYTTTNRLRKLNKRVNNIAKAYDIGCRFPVASLALTSSVSKRSPMGWKCILKLDETALKVNTELNTNGLTEVTMQYDSGKGSYLDTIDDILNKVELHGTLEISKFFGIDDKLLSVFMSNRKGLRNMTVFIEMNTIIGCLEEAAKNFIIASRKLQGFHIECQRKSRNTFLQTEILRQRKWDSLTIKSYNSRNNFDYPMLNDAFLLQVVKNCECCTIYFRDDKCTHFTVDGVINLVEAIILESKNTDSIDLGSVSHPNTNWFHYAEKKLLAIHSGITCSYETCEDRTERYKHYFKICLPSHLNYAAIEFYQWADDEFEQDEE